MPPPPTTPQAQGEQPDAAPSWKLPLCTTCGYPLHGLPDFGDCPECGCRFDRSRIVLTGQVRGDLLNSIARSKLLSAILICLGAASCARGVSKVVAHGDWGGAVNLMVVVYWSVATALAVWAVRTHPLPGVSRVWIDADGVRTVRDVTVELWNTPATARRLFHWLCLPTYLFFLLVVIKGDPWQWFALASCGALFCATMILFVVAERRRRRQPSPEPPSAKFTSWAEVGSIELRPARRGWQRLKIRVAVSNRIGAIDAVNAKVFCDDEQAVAVRRSMADWSKPRT